MMSPDMPEFRKTPNPLSDWEFAVVKPYVINILRSFDDFDIHSATATHRMKRGELTKKIKDNVDDVIEFAGVIFDNEVIYRTRKNEFEELPSGFSGIPYQTLRGYLTMGILDPTPMAKFDCEDKNYGEYELRAGYNLFLLPLTAIEIDRSTREDTVSDLQGIAKKYFL